MNIPLTIAIAVLIPSFSLIANAPTKAESALRSDGVIIAAWPSKIARDESRKSPPLGAKIYFYVIAVTKLEADGIIHTTNVLAWSITCQRINQHVRLRKSEDVWAARPGHRDNACSNYEEYAANNVNAGYEIAHW